ARCMRGDQPDGRSPAGTRRSSHARGLSLTLAAPGMKPRRYVLVGDPATLVEFLETRLDLVQLPALCLNKSRDRFRGEKRLRAAGPLRECFKPLLGVGIDAHRKGCCH